MVSELEGLDPTSNISWCRRYAHWWDRLTISRERPIISTRAIATTDAWLAQHGLQQGKIPHEMRPHSH